MKLSIITINLNNKNGLIKTLNSISSQDYQDFEHIVVDGQSSDGSEEIIRQNPRINSWISELDTGVYDAMNKGIKHAKGEYLLFLNSGDYLVDENVLKTVISKVNTEEIIYGNLLINENNTKKKYYYPSKITFDFMFDYSLGHPCTFIKKTLFDKVGLYKTNHKIISDWIFFVDALIRYNASVKYITDIISVFHTDGMSSNPENIESINNERIAYLKSEYAVLYDDYIKFRQTNYILQRIKSCKAYKWLKALGVKKFQY